MVDVSEAEEEGSLLVLGQRAYVVREGVERGPREIVGGKGLVDVLGGEGVVRALGELSGELAGGNVVTLSEWNRVRLASTSTRRAIAHGTMGLLVPMKVD